MTLSLFITLPLPGTSASVVSGFSMMTTAIQISGGKKCELTRTPYTHTHTRGHTFVLLRNHGALVPPSVEILQDLHQFGDASGEASGGQKKKKHNSAHWSDSNCVQWSRKLQAAGFT